ncbi:MAG: hypothetical protein NT027_07390 [Proteobacteria bacterium]|nr:hypothetical protein [Pseudomonadota bacterium]
MNSRKPRSHHSDHVVLDDASIAKVSGWIHSINPKLKGSKVTKSDLVNWILSQQAHDLTENQQSEIEQHFFDPVKAVAWVTDEIQRRQKAGEKFDVQEFINASLLRAIHVAKNTSSRLKERPKKIPSQSLESSNGKLVSKDS